jgi:hypothetical protein
MKFLMAVLAYLVIGVVLGLGMLQAVKGSPLFLLIGLAAYIAIFGKIGCLPKKTEAHH